MYINTPRTIPAESRIIAGRRFTKDNFSAAHFVDSASDCACISQTQGVRSLSNFMLPKIHPPSIPINMPLAM